MHSNSTSRRRFLKHALTTAAAAAAGSMLSNNSSLAATEAGVDDSHGPGSRRLSLEQLRKWESLKYGMFIHFGMST